MSKLAAATVRVRVTRELIRLARRFCHWVWTQHDKALAKLAAESHAAVLEARDAAVAARRAHEEAERTAAHRAHQAQLITIAASEESEELRLRNVTISHGVIK